MTPAARIDEALALLSALSIRNLRREHTQRLQGVHGALAYYRAQRFGAEGLERLSVSGLPRELLQRCEATLELALFAPGQTLPQRKMLRGCLGTVRAVRRALDQEADAQCWTARDWGAAAMPTGDRV